MGNPEPHGRAVYRKMGRDFLPGTQGVTWRICLGLPDERGDRRDPGVVRVLELGRVIGARQRDELFAWHSETAKKTFAFAGRNVDVAVAENQERRHGEPRGIENVELAVVLEIRGDRDRS